MLEEMKEILQGIAAAVAMTVAVVLPVVVLESWLLSSVIDAIR